MGRTSVVEYVFSSLSLLLSVFIRVMNCVCVLLLYPRDAADLVPGCRSQVDDDCRSVAAGERLQQWARHDPEDTVTREHGRESATGTATVFRGMHTCLGDCGRVAGNTRNPLRRPCPSAFFGAGASTRHACQKEAWWKPSDTSLHFGQLHLTCKVDERRTRCGFPVPLQVRLFASETRIKQLPIISPQTVVVMRARATQCFTPTWRCRKCAQTKSASLRSACENEHDSLKSPQRRPRCMVWFGIGIGMVWYGMVWYGMVWYGMVWYGMVWYGMVWYGMVWYGMVWYGMVWYGMVWYGMVWYGMVWYGMDSFELTLALQACCLRHSFVLKVRVAQREELVGGRARHQVHEEREVARLRQRCIAAVAHAHCHVAADAEVERCLNAIRLMRLRPNKISLVQIPLRERKTKLIRCLLWLVRLSRIL